jgi:hypothetical protein
MDEVATGLFIRLLVGSNRRERDVLLGSEDSSEFASERQILPPSLEIPCLPFKQKRHRG